MAKAQYVQIGNAIDYLNASEQDIKYGDVVAMSGCIGIARADIPVSEVGTVGITEAYELPATGVISVGSPVYWDATEDVITTEAAGNIPAGICLTNKTDAATGTAVVRLSPSVTAITVPESEDEA